jgi:hypothetical protein
MSLPEVLRSPLTLPLVASPMFIASGPALVTAQCQAGVIGAFPALNARPAALLDDWLHEIAESNATFAAQNPDAVVAPFAVNQIVHKSNDRLDADMELVVKHEVPIVITSLGARPEINEAVHSYGGIVLHETAGVTRGEDPHQHHSLGTCEWENITLTGQVTKDRKDMLQWYQDMVQKGSEADCFRDVTLTWLKRDTSDDRAVTWNECFLLGYSLTPLDGDEMDVECIETIEICTGYSPNYLG